MRLLLVAVAAIALTVLVDFAPRSEGQSRPTNAEQHVQAEPNSDAKHNVNEQHSGDSETEAETPTNEPPHWYESPEWILVIVGAITGGIVCYQSILTRRAVQAAERLIKPTKKSAKAALLNAQAVINSERAWVDVDMFLGTSGDVVRLTNHGRSLARIQKITLTYISYPEDVVEIPNSESLPSGLPSGEVYRFGQIETRDEILAVGKIEVPVVTFIIAQYLSEHDRVGKTFPVFHVRVEYRDILDGTAQHFTEVVYLYRHQPPSLHYLPKYTKYT